jgi:CDP-glycerol glycerophosphotransferase (TagB/SpsB family)
MTRRQRRLRTALVRIGFAAGSLLPVRRRVVLATAHATSLSGNLAWIRDRLAATEPSVSVTVLASWTRGGRVGALRAALDGLVAGWHLATASLFIVDDYFFPMYAIRPRRGTRFVQVWHACGAFKRFGYGTSDKSFGADEAALAEFPIHTNYDLCFVSAMRFAPFYAEAFRQPIERFTARLGIPRTDAFFDSERTARVTASIRERYGIPAGKRVVLYAPTFRGEQITRARSPEDLDFEALQRAVGADHVVLLRAHPFVAARQQLGDALAGFVIDVSDEPELNDLMLVSDVLVTDYSSAMYEFALLDRPIAFFAPDHAAYERERGFYLDYARDLPGPIFETSEALATWLAVGRFDLEAIRRFRAASFEVADGRSTQRFVDEVVLPATRP